MLVPPYIFTFNLPPPSPPVLYNLAMFISIPWFTISHVLAYKYERFPFIFLAQGLGPFNSLSLYLFKNYNQLLMSNGIIGIEYELTHAHVY